MERVISGRLTVVVPAFNEASRLPFTLPVLSGFCDSRPGTDVIVVNDGSLDRTRTVLDAFVRDHPCVRAIHNASNHGKGYAVRQGVREATGDWILITDADLSTPLDELEKLFTAAETSGASISIGSRALDRRLIGVHQSATREWVGRFFNLVMRLITGLPFLDTQCGFKLYRRDAADIVFSRQRLEGFGADVENLVIARQHALRAVEVPVRWNNVEDTRVGPLSGGRAFADLLVVRWNELTGVYR